MMSPSFPFYVFVRTSVMAACVLGGLGQSAQAQVQEQGPAALYESLKARYRKITTFRSNLSCELRLLGPASESVTGSIAIERPAKWNVRLEAQSKGRAPTSLVLFDLCNGGSRWTFDSRSKSVIKQDISRDGNPGPGNFFPAFDLYDDASVKLLSQRDQRIQLRLASKQKSTLFAAVILSVNRQWNLVEQMEFLDWKGDTTMKIFFEDAQVNGPPDASLFSADALPRFPVRRFVPEPNPQKQNP